jgi:transposase InsO family protein
VTEDSAEHSEHYNDAGERRQRQPAVESRVGAVNMAILTRRPAANLIHHSDRGVQYASADYRTALHSAGMQASMRRRADCYDNAPMESFFHTLKTEQVHHQQYATREHAAISLPTSKASIIEHAVIPRSDIPLRSRSS